MLRRLHELGLIAVAFASLHHRHDGLTAQLLAAAHARRDELSNNVLGRLLWHCAVMDVPYGFQVREMVAECNAPWRADQWFPPAMAQLMQASRACILMVYFPCTYVGRTKQAVVLYRCFDAARCIGVRAGVQRALVGGAVAAAHRGTADADKRRLGVCC